METTFKVVACNASNGGKTFVWKLETTTTAKAFGITKTIKRTYYIGGMPQQAAIGTELKEDLSRFDIVERAFVVAGENGEEDTTMMLKWLHVKAA